MSAERRSEQMSELIGPAASLGDAARCMLRAGTDRLSIEDATGVMGAVEPIDVAIAVLVNQADPGTTTVGEVMRPLCPFCARL